MAKKAGKHPGGRPSLYNPAIAKRICSMLSEGLTVREVGAKDGMPDARTIMRWLPIHDEFRQQYAQAMEFRSHFMAEELLEIADDSTNDWMKRNGGEDNEAWVANGENINRSRLRVDTRKWLMSKMAPKKYGDKTDVIHGVSDDVADLLQMINGQSRGRPNPK